MNNLTIKEINFINELKKDHNKNNDNSFLSILFHGVFLNHELILKEINDLFNNYYCDLVNNSDLIMYSIGTRYIGKLKNTFWGTNSDGEVFGMGQEIQNIAFLIICSYYGNVKDIDEKKDVDEYFKKHLSLDYDDYIDSYRNFCLSLGFEYKEDLDLINQQSKDFENELEYLK